MNRLPSLRVQYSLVHESVKVVWRSDNLDVGIPAESMGVASPME